MIFSFLINAFPKISTVGKLSGCNAISNYRYQSSLISTKFYSKVNIIKIFCSFNYFAVLF